MNFKILLVLSLTFLGIVYVVFDRMHAPDTTLEMYVEAENYREAHNLELPPQIFKYDGCTLFPERIFGLDISNACLEHDIAYWLGGDEFDKYHADNVLWNQVRASGSLGFIVAPFMYVGVWMFGDTWVVELFDANWGFGWNI